MGFIQADQYQRNSIALDLSTSYFFSVEPNFNHYSIQVFVPKQIP